jgi:hypothetical protein
MRDSPAVRSQNNDKRRTAMKEVRGLAVGKILLAVRIIVIAAGIAQAQADLPVFAGKFNLVTQVRWNTLTLRPGDYSVTIENEGLPAFAVVRDSKGRALGRLMCQVVGAPTNAHNALFIREKDGQFRVYSLNLGSIGKMLVYDPALAKEAVLDARAPQTVPVMLAKR